MDTMTSKGQLSQYQQQEETLNDNTNNSFFAVQNDLNTRPESGEKVPSLPTISYAHSHPPLIDRSSFTQFPTQPTFINNSIPTLQELPRDDFVDSGQSDDNEDYSFATPNSAIGRFFESINKRYQHFLDWSTPHWKGRWGFTLFAFFIFMVRIVVSQGWYIICYGLSLYYLSLFISFLSPKIDPAFQPGGEFADEDEYDSQSGPMLPTSANQEFKPFIRRLPEFKFWLMATHATLLSLALTCFEIFDVPVFWPILFIYFILLFISSMRQQIRHMWRYKYVPWSRGKRRYGGNKEDSVKLYPTVI